MNLRRAMAALPLALSVAVVAHTIGFGADHAPGGGHVAMLLASILASFSACLAWVFGIGFFGVATRTSIATKASLGYWSLAVICGAAIAFWAIEFFEGHASLAPGTIRAMLALVPVALLLGTVAARAGATVSHIGRLAAHAIARTASIVSIHTRRARNDAFTGIAFFRAHATRDRAPPQPA